MAAARPFDSAEATAVIADVIWASLDREDWLEAFSAHPRIGEKRTGRAGWAGRDGGHGGNGEEWSAEEQRGVTEGSRSRFEQLNRDYEARFGYIFIVCATGKSAAELLAELERRLGHDAEVELREAVEAQRQITRIRLAKLLT